ncbi:uncharacterized protein LOC101850031 [Aplysia californica]|uniref:Uncharacterized protein LOC101850031 n=1 Tax=Aplysia californica TaxID=6500 RepID=A0ABM0K240_APLCA|nr:uncharacterized protein LOC101850031 [Aplysia californica]
MEYSNCKCVVSPHMTSHKSRPDRTGRELLVGFLGSLVGLGLSVPTFFLFRSWLRRCRSPGGFRCSRRVSKGNKPVGERTRRWVDGHNMPAVETPYLRKMPPSGLSGGSDVRSVASGKTNVTNIYRATFNDDNIHSTAPKKNLTTYRSGAKDWG